MRIMDILDDRRMGLLAIIGPAYALGSIVLAIMLSPWFSWTDNAISDLGVHPVAPIFNTSLIIAGILCALFTVSPAIRLKHWLGKTGMVLLLLACISLVGIGAFTENSPPWHYYFSVAFFVLLLFASLLTGIHFMKKRSTRYLGLFAIMVAIIGITGWSIDWGRGVAIPEALSFVPGGIWIMLLGHWRLISGSGKRAPAEK